MFKHALIFPVIVLCLVGCKRSSTSSYHKIIINEVLPNNGLFGELNDSSPDWIELYNPNAFPVDLAGYYLSDNPGDLTKWAFPQGIQIASRGYLRIWTGDDDLNAMSAGFGLNETFGETISLTARDTVTVLDRVEIPPLQRDISLVRLLDGQGTPRWLPTGIVTPLGANRLGGMQIRIVNISPAYPMTPITFQVQAPGAAEGMPVVLHTRIDKDDLPWESVPMVQQSTSPQFYSHTLSGEALTRGVLVEFYVTSEADYGFDISDPPEIDNDTSKPYRLQVGNKDIAHGQLSITEVMPWNGDYILKEFGTGTPGWFEIINYGQKSVSLGMIGIREVVSSNTFPTILSNQLNPCQRNMFFANADTTGQELSFRLTGSIGIILLEYQENEIARLAYDISSGRNGSFGTQDGRLTDPGRELPFGTPLLPNPPDDQEEIYFAGDPAVWVDWTDSAVLVENGEVAVFAKVLWPDARLYERETPEVTLHWQCNDEPVASAAMEEELLHYPFVGYIPVQEGVASVVRYVVEVKTGPNQSLWHSALGVTTTAPSLEDGHGFALNVDVPLLVITEVGLIPEDHDGGGLYAAYPAPDGSGVVNKRRTYVEIYNAGDAAVDLEGLYLSLVDRSSLVVQNSRYHSEEWALPAAVLPAGGYHVIELDGLTVDAPSLLGHFRGSVVSLHDALSRGNGLIDRFSFEAMDVWATPGAFGRSLDDPTGVKMAPTPGAPNVIPVKPDILINELVWEDGNKWMELVNVGEETVSIDDLDLKVVMQGRGWVAERQLDLADPLSLAPGALLVLVIEGDQTPGLPFAMNVGVSSLFYGAVSALTEEWLWTEQERLLDDLSQPDFVDGFANGRMPDGGEGWFEVLVPTPGSPNALPILINEVYPAPDGGFVELLNQSTQDFDVSGFQLAGAFPPPAVTHVLEPGSVIPAGGYLAVYLVDLDAMDNMVLYDPYDGRLDSLSWSDVPEAQAWGRLPDGSETLSLLNPTPEQTNQPPGHLFIRGDCNGDGTVDLSRQDVNTDLAALVAYLENPGTDVDCEDRLDINDDGRISTADIIGFMVNLLNQDPPDIPAPFPEPGLDPTEDALHCEP